MKTRSMSVSPMPAAPADCFGETDSDDVDVKAKREVNVLEKVFVWHFDFESARPDASLIIKLTYRSKTQDRLRILRTAFMIGLLVGLSHGISSGRAST